MIKGNHTKHNSLSFLKSKFRMGRRPFRGFPLSHFLILVYGKFVNNTCLFCVQIMNFSTLYFGVLKL